MYNVVKYNETFLEERNLRTKKMEEMCQILLELIQEKSIETSSVCYENDDIRIKIGKYYTFYFNVSNSYESPGYNIWIKIYLVICKNNDAEDDIVISDKFLLEQTEDVKNFVYKIFKIFCDSLTQLKPN